MGMLFHLIGIPVLLASFNVSTKIAVLIGFLTSPVTGYTIWKTNKVYLQKLTTKVEQESQFLTEILQGKLKK